MGNKIKVAVAGIGNCASSLIQGIHHYSNEDVLKDAYGLMHAEANGYKPGDMTEYPGMEN